MLIEPKTEKRRPARSGLPCGECGTRNTADSKYCKECGAKIQEDRPAVVLSESDRAAVAEAPGQERLAKLLDMAFWHNEAGNAEAAILACEAALVIHPHCTTAHSLLGSLYEKKGDDDKAALHFETVVALNPDSAADQTKLEQLRRGVHMKPVAPPPPSRWLPPVLNDLSERLALSGSPFAGTNLAAPGPPALEDDAERARSFRLRPLVVSVAVAALVLAVGLFAVRPSAPPRRAALFLPPVPARAVTASAFGAQAVTGLDDAAPSSRAAPAPIVMQGGASTPVKTAPLPVLPASADPFTETVKPGDALQPVVRAPRPAHLARRAGGNLTLPPLSLRAVPLPGADTVAPAPVSFPAGASVPVTASVASVPQHTVVVSRLGGPAQGTQAASFVPPGSSDANGGQASHIRISIHASPGGDTLSLSDHATPDNAAPAASNSAGDGDRYQQSALALQQQGDFRRARAAYEKAIRAYQAQIAAGRDPQTASAGLQACQTGLQICQQSAP